MAVGMSFPSELCRKLGEHSTACKLNMEMPDFMPNLIVWAVVVLGIGGFAIGSMINAYLQPIPAVPFAGELVESLSMPLSTAAQERFAGAVGTYKAGDYRGAIEQFTRVIEEEKGCAEAWHNVGLAYANIGANNKAVRSLLKASDAYDKQGTKAGLDRIKQNLETLKGL